MKYMGRQVDKVIDTCIFNDGTIKSIVVYDKDLKNKNEKYEITLRENYIKFGTLIIGAKVAKQVGLMYETEIKLSAFNCKTSKSKSIMVKTNKNVLGRIDGLTRVFEELEIEGDKSATVKYDSVSKNLNIYFR